MIKNLIFTIVLMFMLHMLPAIAAENICKIDLFYNLNTNEDRVFAEQVCLKEAKIDNNAHAFFVIGQVLHQGLGYNVDYLTAETWYLKAAQAGLLEAKIELANLYSYQLKQTHLSKLPKLYEDIIYNHGKIEYKFFFAKILLENDFADIVDERALGEKLLNESLEDDPYFNKLIYAVTLYNSGALDDPDPATTNKNLKLAVQDGHTDAAVLLARRLDKTPKNLDTIKKLLEAAAMNFDMEAAYELGLLYLRTNRSSSDREAARFWLAKAAKSGSAEAQINLVLSETTGPEGNNIPDPCSTDTLAIDQKNCSTIKRMIDSFGFASSSNVPIYGWRPADDLYKKITAAKYLLDLPDRVRLENIIQMLDSAQQAPVFAKLEELVGGVSLAASEGNGAPDIDLNSIDYMGSWSRDFVNSVSSLRPYSQHNANIINRWVEQKRRDLGTGLFTASKTPANWSFRLVCSKADGNGVQGHLGLVNFENALIKSSPMSMDGICSFKLKETVVCNCSGGSNHLPSLDRDSGNEVILSWDNDRSRGDFCVSDEKSYTEWREFVYAEPAEKCSSVKTELDLIQQVALATLKSRRGLSNIFGVELAANLFPKKAASAFFEKSELYLANPFLGRFTISQVWSALADRYGCDSRTPNFYVWKQSPDHRENLYLGCPVEGGGHILVGVVPSVNPGLPKERIRELTRQIIERERGANIVFTTSAKPTVL